MKRFAILVLSLWLAVGLFGATKVGGSGTSKIGGVGKSKIGTGYSGTPDILWWKGNTGSGTTDTATVGPNCTLSSASIWDTGFTPGGSTSDLTFNGTTYYANSASTVSYSASNKITVEFRLYRTSFPAAIAVYLESSAAWNGDINRWAVIQGDGIIWNTGICFMVSDNTGLQKIYSITSPSTSTWHHIAAVMDNSSSAAPLVYVDGSLVGTTLQNNAWATAGNFTTQTLYYGSRAGTTYWAAASAKDVRIFAGARSAANIAADATNYP